MDVWVIWLLLACVVVVQGWSFTRGRSRNTETKAKSSTHMDGQKPRDLYVLVHGLSGRPTDLQYLQRCLRLRDPKALVHLAQCNSGTFMTYDGIQKGGSRLANEIRQLKEKYPSLLRISLVGNSLGGLYCRYAMALLYDTKTGKVCGLEPFKYLTTATPHLGVGVYGYLSGIPEIVQRFGAKTFTGQTIRELLLLDSDDRRIPLLVRMSGAAKEELPFTTSLRAFKERCAFANVKNDFVVAYKTALPDGPLSNENNFDSSRRDIPRILSRISIKAKAQPSPFEMKSIRPSIAFSDYIFHDVRKGLMQRMSHSLSSAGWEQVTVEFPGYVPLAHNKICALERDPIMTWLNKEGRPIVQEQARW
eukprot:CAMPEP_0167745076 /NCGR_PEP_ID=MMETSP0110_2-20121227/2949_1 /TAXON_ID=629695 /ORGANISM="Gymnochlora sp., Strain CCMP2014" /LENGTH=361 /DNA_ID=CAMNT_0007629675 /DNA_START=83 /DNA_END=1165 /DNA_ORIENTATION=-